MNNHFTSNFNKIFSQPSPTGRNPSQPNLQPSSPHTELGKEIHSIFSELYKHNDHDFDASELEMRLIVDCKNEL